MERSTLDLHQEWRMSKLLRLSTCGLWIPALHLELSYIVRNTSVGDVTPMSGRMDVRMDVIWHFHEQAGFNWKFERHASLCKNY